MRCYEVGARSGVFGRDPVRSGEILRGRARYHEVGRGPASSGEVLRVQARSH